MNDTFPRPPRGQGFSRLVYNILKDNLGWKSPDEIWALVPKKLHVAYARKKFNCALGNMTHRGWLVARGAPRSKQYRLASKSHFDAVQAKLKANKSKSKKAKPAAAKAVPCTASVFSRIDEKIKLYESQIRELTALKDTIKEFDL